MLIANKYFKEGQEHIESSCSSTRRSCRPHGPWPISKTGQGDLAGAMEEMRKAISLDPIRAESFLNYAIMQMQPSNTTRPRPA